MAIARIINKKKSKKSMSAKKINYSILGAPQKGQYPYEEENSLEHSRHFIFNLSPQPVQNLLLIKLISPHDPHSTTVVSRASLRLSCSSNVFFGLNTR